MTSLTERIEAATGPCRELDAEIAATLCGGSVDSGGRFWKPGVRGFCISDRFTSSLDAAMTLVVDGWRVYHMADETSVKFQSSKGWIVCVDNNDCYGEGYMQIVVDAKTPALALCAAALRARGVE